MWSKYGLNTYEHRVHSKIIIVIKKPFILMKGFFIFFDKFLFKILGKFLSGNGIRFCDPCAGIIIITTPNTAWCIVDS